MYLFVFYFLSIEINSDIFAVRHVLIFQMCQPIGFIGPEAHWLFNNSNFVSLNFLKYINATYKHSGSTKNVMRTLQQVQQTYQV